MKAQHVHEHSIFGILHGSSISIIILKSIIIRQPSLPRTVPMACLLHWGKWYRYSKELTIFGCRLYFHRGDVMCSEVTHNGSSMNETEISFAICLGLSISSSMRQLSLKSGTKVLFIRFYVWYKFILQKDQLHDELNCVHIWQMNYMMNWISLIFGRWIVWRIKSRSYLTDELHDELNHVHIWIIWWIELRSYLTDELHNEFEARLYLADELHDELNHVYIWQMNYMMNQVYIWQMRPRLSWGDTCQIWTYYWIDNQYSYNSEIRKWGYWLDNTHHKVRYSGLPL